MDILELQGELFVSYSFLKSYSVSQKTIEDWKQRNIGKRHYVNNRCFIAISSIPRTTLKKIPSESDLKSLLNQEQHNQEQDYYTNLLKSAYERDFLKFQGEYRKDKRLTTEQVTQCAHLRAVWEKVLEMNDGKKGSTYLLFKAFNSVFDNKYASYETFCTLKSKARKNINSVVVDTRWFREQESTIDIEIHYWARTLISDPVNNSAKSIWNNLQSICKQSNKTAPSYSWVKKIVRENERNLEIYASRFGKEKAFNNIQPYAKIIHARNAGSQWQIDGWDLPFYYKGDFKGKLTSHLKLVLFVVRDSYSKKIVGYDIGESENTELILNAIQDAVRSTGFFPFEIVSDNHSFNKTKEAEFFKQAIDSIGVTWTVDMNPRRKALAERYFRHLGENHCKKYPGYIGQGIKTREKSGRPAQEYSDTFTKSSNWLSKKEVKLIGIKVVEEFNNSSLEKLNGLTPNESHERSDKPHAIPVDIFDRLRIFIRRSEHKVIRGQINLTRAGRVYEYQLDSEQNFRFNNKKITVRYEDFGTIYLFDEKDRPIGSVKQKVSIHGALADQTPEDIEKLYKNKGRLNGIKARSKKENEALRDKTLEISPNAYEALNPLITPKNILKEVEQNYELKRRAEEMGIELDTVEIGIKPENMIVPSLKPSESKIKSPFSVRDQHKVSVIDLRNENDD